LGNFVVDDNFVQDVGEVSTSYASDVGNDHKVAAKPCCGDCDRKERSQNIRVIVKPIRVTLARGTFKASEYLVEAYLRRRFADTQFIKALANIFERV